MTQLNEHQVFERDWWGNCVNTFGEEAKQLTYAQLMGLTNVPDPTTSHWPQYDLVGLNVLDLGGGPASMLLKTVDPGRLTVVDPCPYPPWVAARYTEAGIEYFQEPAETFVSTPTRGRNNVELYDYDEVWIYNVLQHVEDPAACIATARRQRHRPPRCRERRHRICLLRSLQPDAARFRGAPVGSGDEHLRPDTDGEEHPHF
jgi:hypothetical protein